MKRWHDDPLRLRRRSILIAVPLVAGTLAVLLVLAIWAAIALFGWLNDGIPALADAVSTYVPAILRQFDEILPGASELLRTWLDRVMGGVY